MSFSPRFLCIIIFLMVTIAGKTQNNRLPHQLTVISENDSYLSVNNDGYYTNGIKISYQWLKPVTDSMRLVKFHNLEIGQLIYNGKEGYYADISDIDRPIAGYLYGSYNQTRYNKKDNMFNWGIAAGTIGNASLGRQTQELIHGWMNIYKPKQWKYQLQAGWGLTASVKWSPQITDRSRNSKFAFKPVVGASVGNFFTNAMLGSAILFGRFNANAATAFWNNHSSTLKRQREYFFYVYPALYLQAYNATVQGNMFKSELGMIPGKLNPFFFQNKVGFMCARNKFAVGFAALYESKQSLTQQTSHWYGSAQVSYSW